MPHLLRIWVEHSISNHVVHCQACGWTGHGHQQRHLFLYWWHIHLWECVSHSSCEGTSWVVWIDQQGPWTLRNSTYVFGLDVWEEYGRLQWWCESEFLTTPNILTRRSIFSLCGKMTEHLPVRDWLCES